jgi:hypothetical protein
MSDYPYSGIERRQAPRSTIAVDATLRASGGHRINVALKDISEIGFRCEYASDLKIGELMWLKFADFEAMEVDVIRRDGYDYGLRFQRPLHTAMLDHVVNRYGRVVA